MAEFEPAVEITLENEGGYTWDASDPGGETNFGISKRSYPDVDIRNLTRDEAKAIYLRDFWKFGGIEDQDVANKVFDAFVNMGHEAIKLLQTVLGLSPDGEYGPQTESHVNATDASNLLMAYRTALVDFYAHLVAERPSDEKFLAGWTRRANQ